MVSLELNGELLSNDSLDVLVGTRFSSGRAGPGISAVVLINEYVILKVMDLKWSILCSSHSHSFYSFVRLGTVRCLLHLVAILKLFWVFWPLKDDSNMLASWYTCAAEAVAKDINGYWKKQRKKMGFQVLETILNTKKSITVDTWQFCLWRCIYTTCF